VLSVFIYLVPNTMFSALGGLIGWSLFRPKRDGQ
jgi:hypothetical protein